MPSDRQCAKTVYAQGMSFSRGHQCRYRGSLQEEGKWWCRIHAPSRRKATAVKRREDFDLRTDSYHVQLAGQSLIQVAAARLGMTRLEAVEALTVEDLVAGYRLRVPE